MGGETNMAAHACFNHGETLTPQATADLLAQSAVLLVDVREASEYAQEKIVGAINMPLSGLDPNVIAGLAQDAGKPLLLHCKAGGRSAQAMALCHRANISPIAHMGGGLMAWKAQLLPTSSDHQ